LPGHKVLCRDNSNDKTHFYEATVRKVKCVSGTEWSFFVHYAGWNSRWDRWATKDDLMKDTPENRKAHLKPKEVPVPQKKRKKDQAEGTSSSGRKRKSATEASGKMKLYYQEYCELPFTLQTVLVDEYEIITRKGYVNPRFFDKEPPARPARKVHTLPAKVSVKQVIQHYQRKRGGRSSNNKNEDCGDDDKVKKQQQQVRKFCDGLALLFDDALPVCLLYPEERPQYESTMMQEDEDEDEDDTASKKKRPCEIYGCEFLLRLMVRLPALLEAEPQSEMDVMGPLIADLIVLLQKNRQACFKSTYREPKDIELLEFEKALADKDKKSAASSSAIKYKETQSMEH
jgi:mortality factor 4-like protein 1